VLASFGATAEIYRCVDKVTGAISLTDVACDDKQVGTAIEVLPDSSSRQDLSKQQYKFPNTSKKYAKPEASSNRRDRVRAALESISDLVLALESEPKTKSYSSKRIQDLKLDYQSLERECPR